MGLLSSLFKILHPFRTVKQSVKRAIIPRPIRRAKWIVGGIANPVDRFGYSVRRSAIRTVDKAITPKRRRRRVPVNKSTARRVLAPTKQVSVLHDGFWWQQVARRWWWWDGTTWQLWADQIKRPSI